VTTPETDALECSAVCNNWLLDQFTVYENREDVTGLDDARRSRQLTRSRDGAPRFVDDVERTARRHDCLCCFRQSMTANDVRDFDAACLVSKFVTDSHEVLIDVDFVKTETIALMLVTPEIEPSAQQD
jgi:hypothetical protein